jgi:hypothetical protein
LVIAQLQSVRPTGVTSAAILFSRKSKQKEEHQWNKEQRSCPVSTRINHAGNDDAKRSAPKELAQIQNSLCELQMEPCHLLASILRPDCEISECHSDELTIHFSQCLIQLQEMGAAKFQLVLVRLMNSANRII